MLRRRFLTAALIAAVAALASPSVSQAAFTIQLSETGGPSVTVSDRSATGGVLGAGTIQDANINSPGTATPGPGQITVGTSDGTNISPGASLGDFIVNFSGSERENLARSLTIGASSDGITRVVNQSSTAKTLKITLTEDGYTLPGGPANLAVTNSLTLLGVDGLTDNFSLSSTTQIFNNTPLANTLNLSTSIPGTALGTASSSGIFARNGSGPYTVIHTFTLTLDAGATATFNGQTLAAVPAPAGLVLVATAVPFFGLIRRRMKSAPTA